MGIGDRAPVVRPGVPEWWAFLVGQCQRCAEVIGIAKQGNTMLPALIEELEKPESASITAELVMVLYQMGTTFQVNTEKGS